MGQDFDQVSVSEEGSSTVGCRPQWCQAQEKRARPTGQCPGDLALSAHSGKADGHSTHRNPRKKNAVSLRIR